MLLAGGVLLVLLGFFGGAHYAAFDLYRHEAQEAAVDQALADYGQLQGEKAVKIAAHAHSIEFGLLAMMLAFLQPYVNLRESWKRRWAVVLLIGSLLLPVCVFFEPRCGLLAGGLADFGGLLVINALLAMWVGILRYTGLLDASRANFGGGVSK